MHYWRNLFFVAWISVLLGSGEPTCFGKERDFLFALRARDDVAEVPTTCEAQNKLQLIGDSIDLLWPWHGNSFLC